MRTYLTIVFALALTVLPLHAAAQADPSNPAPTPSDPYTFRRQGVFGCSQTGSYSMSVGSLSAVGGVYVPVNDAAVTLNTGYLVYKECVLRGVVNRQREAATAGNVQQVINTVLTGRDGNPQFIQRIGAERNDEYARAMVRSLQDGSLNSVNPAFNTVVKRAIAQGYKQALTSPGQVFSCRYAGNLQSLLEGREFSLKSLSALMNPSCNPYWSYERANRYANDLAVNHVGGVMEEVGWGRGYYPVQQCDEFGNCLTVTPGAVVEGNFSRALQSGFDQLERANDIDQMVGALFSGMISQVLGDNRGILGLVQRTGSQPSYIEQVVKESAQGLRDAAGNAALQILSAARQVEAAFKAAMDAIAGMLTATIQDLRAKEATCWNIVIQSVCATPVAADKTCSEKVGECTTDPATGQQTCPSAGKLKVATSTAYSQAVINARIVSLASSTVTNIEKSANATTLIDRLIAGITNTASLDAQRVALQQLDNLVAQRTLHSQYDLQQAQKAKDDVTASMETLRTDTLKAWTESTDVNTGWCNVNNQALVSYWKQRWKQ